MKKKLINITRGVLLILPIIMLVQQVFDRPILDGLKGAYTTVVFPKLTYKNWDNRFFQDVFEDYSIQNFGYNEYMVRLHNQLIYSVFGDSPNDGVLLKTDNYLIGQGYLDAYVGKDFFGADSIEYRCRKLSEIGDYLKQRDKQLVVVLAPDKASYFSDIYNLPIDSLIDSTNYKVYRHYLEEYDVPFVDFRRAFLDMKDSSKYPLFPKTGIHWSVYGMQWAVDSIFDFLENELGRPMPEMKVNNVVVKKIDRNVEMDIELALNLIFKLNQFDMAYQKFDMEIPREGKPKVLVISDSFFAECYYSGFAAQFIDDPVYWYYNSEAYHWNRGYLDQKVRNFPLDSVVDANDAIWLMATSLNLKDFPWKFEEKFDEQILSKED